MRPRSRHLGLAAFVLAGACVESRGDEEFEDVDIDTSGEVPVISWDGPDAVYLAVTGSDDTDTLVCDEDGASGLLYWFAWCPGAAEDGVVETDELNCLASPATYGEPAPEVESSDSTYFYARTLDPGHPDYCLEMLAWGASGEPDTVSVIPFSL